MESLIQTIAILAACVVYLAKVGVEQYRRKKNGSMPSHDILDQRVCSAREVESLIRDLHRWHQPVIDPRTGQPKFMWYETQKSDIRDDLRRQKNQIEEIQHLISEMDKAIKRILAHYKSKEE